MNRIYLDHSATTPVDPGVAEVMLECMTDIFGNPSSIHSFGRQARHLRETARDIIASMLNCQADEVHFTSGGTEADNLALIGYCQANRSTGDHIVISAVEHPAVKSSAQELERRGFRVTQAQVDSYGEVHPEAVVEALTKDTILVSVMHVNNEVGTINDIAGIGEQLKARGVLFHTDAVQSFGKLPLDVRAMNVDMLSLSGHKFYGPKGVGALFIRRGVTVHQRQFGGSQERTVRPGTENLPGIVGMGRAAEMCRSEMWSEAERLMAWRDRLFTHLKAELKGITLNGHPTNRLPGNLHLTFEGVDGEALLMALDMEGIAVSAGSACASGGVTPSAVLTAMGRSSEQARSSLRFTLGRSNSQEQIDRAAGVIVDCVKRLGGRAGG